MLEWKAILRRLDSLALNLEDVDLTGKDIIDWNLIDVYLNGKIVEIDSLVELQDIVKSTKIGRLTLRGPNGSGKSAVLSSLAQGLGKGGFYLPTYYESLSFDGKA